jgi:hydroxybutyrate-dimer hydrolase
VYGAISTGEWGLKRGCAVAYTDKGTGGAPHDLQNDTVPLVDGTRTTASVRAEPQPASSVTSRLQRRA